MGSFPKLPANPFTISDGRPRADQWTPGSVRSKYIGLPKDKDTLEKVHRDLAELRAWDNYSRRTAASREAAKLALKSLEEEIREALHPGRYRCQCGRYRKREAVSQGFTSTGRPVWFCNACIPY